MNTMNKTVFIQDNTTEDESTKDRRQEIINLQERVLLAIAKGDYAEYCDLVDPQVTCFEPETSGHLVFGLPFHKFYFDNIFSKNPRPINTNLLDPYVHFLGEDAAYIAYGRSVQYIDSKGFAISTHAEESRIWQRKNGKWMNVHFHHSGAPTLEPSK